MRAVYVFCTCTAVYVQGKYDDAASLFGKANAAERIIEMWTDLRQYDKATKWAQSSGRGNAAVDALRMQQAQWNEEVRDYKSAAQMYLESGQSERAVSLLAANLTEWTYLLELSRRLDRCAKYSVMYCSPRYCSAQLTVMHCLDVPCHS
jgi:hypothetical protein